MKEKNTTTKVYNKELETNIVNKKNIQSFTKLGCKVIFLKYAAKPQINKYDKLLIPNGKPTTTSLKRPAKNIKQ